jgi:general secretion pathway protein A
VPPASPDAPPGEPLYESFYGLHEPPFALSTDPRFLFLSASHRRAYEELLTGLRRREGILLLTGESGTGKTTLCRAVIDALGHRTFSALILNPYMSDAEVVRVILRDFGLVSREEIRKGAFAKADMPQLLDTLESFLGSLVPLNSYAVVIIDEAQSLAPQVLDQIRMLGGYEQDGQRLLQIMLVGQPALSDTLRTEPMRALNERVTRRTTLSPLSLTEIHDYIRHRLTIAGGRDKVVFTPEAVRQIADLSRGLPRRINILCDRTLEEGQTHRSHELGPDHVREAARSIAWTSSNVVDDPVPIGAEPDTASLEDLKQRLRPDAPTLFEATTAHRPRPRIWPVAALGLLCVAAAPLALYAWMLASQPLELPPLPTRPKLGLAPRPLPIPTDDQVKTMLKKN